MAEKEKTRLEKALEQGGPIDIVRARWAWLGFSLLLLIPGVLMMVYLITTTPDHAPLKLGIDFTGGTFLQYGFEKPLANADLGKIRASFDSLGYHNPVLQLQSGKSGTSQSVLSVRTKPLAAGDADKIKEALSQQFGVITLLQKNAIGPSLAKELFYNALIALLVAYVLIVGYLSIRFQWDYAVAAIIAMIHDTLIALGIFSFLGYFLGTEVDSLFVTALLTVVGFSVHDTIVVFDRIRENMRLYHGKKVPFGQIANFSVNQTLARSINTSLTALLTLLALFFLGGRTVHDFVLAMIIGIVIGTYSSIFVASTLLAWWREGQENTGGKGGIPTGVAVG